MDPCVRKPTTPSPVVNSSTRKRLGETVEEGPSNPKILKTLLETEIDIGKAIERQIEKEIENNSVRNERSSSLSLSVEDLLLPDVDDVWYDGISKETVQSCPKDSTVTKEPASNSTDNFNVKESLNNSLIANGIIVIEDEDEEIRISETQIRKKQFTHTNEKSKLSNLKYKICNSKITKPQSKMFKSREFVDDSESESDQTNKKNTPTAVETSVSKLSSCLNSNPSSKSVNSNNKGQLIKSKDCSGGSESVERMAILISPRKNKQSKDEKDFGLKQCSYILIRGNRKGERCTNRQKASICYTHDKERKESFAKKSLLLEDVDKIKKDNISLRKEVMELKEKVCEINKLQNQTQMINDLKDMCQNYEKQIGDLKKDLTNTKKELNDFKTVFKQMKPPIEETKQNTVLLRRKIQKLERNYTYKLINYPDSDHGTFEFVLGRVEIALPKSFERKTPNEGWCICSGEDGKFKWTQV